MITLAPRNNSSPNAKSLPNIFSGDTSRRSAPSQSTTANPLPQIVHGNSLSQPVPSRSINPGSIIEIIDGDTVRSRGKIYRTVGYNTPEAGHGARCERERVLADKATQRLRQLAVAGGLELEPVRCACQPGTEGTDRCNFGRSCAILRTRGQDVGPILITEGLAKSYVCGNTSCPRRRRHCIQSCESTPRLERRL